MPSVHIGEFGLAGATREWISAQGELAIRHLIKICGLPPAGMELEVQWQEHDSGSYPLIVLLWEDGAYGPRGVPEDYVQRCIEALDAYEDNF